LVLQRHGQRDVTQSAVLTWLFLATLTAVEGIAPITLHVGILLALSASRRVTMWQLEKDSREIVDKGGRRRTMVTMLRRKR